MRRGFSGVVAIGKQASFVFINWHGGKTMNVALGALLCWSLLFTSACTSNTVIRSVAGTCEYQAALLAHDGDCGKNMMEHHVWVPPASGDATDPASAADYTLAYVEFDDEGKPYEPGQERLLFDSLARESRSRDLSIIVFVHGWKHNAAPGDDNVGDFRKLLVGVAELEAQKAPADRRHVFGVYAGWRGLSATVPVVYNLSFWERKDAAHRVAEGAIRGLLGKLRAFRDTLSLERPLPGSNRPRETRLLTIGHSFGALIVWSALSQYFIDRAAISLVQARYFPNAGAVDHPAEKQADPRLISSYGDLVVLVNPAIEAMRYEPLRELAAEQAVLGKSKDSYARCQSPVLVEVTSVGDSTGPGDDATGTYFPLGRKINSVLERTRDDPVTGERERDQIETALGQYRPFWTHDLNAPSRDLPKSERQPLIPATRDEDDQSFRVFERAHRIDGYLLPGWTRTYRSGAILSHRDPSPYDANNPFWIVRAHPNVIIDHNDISAPVFEGFIAQLYDDLDRLRHAPECRAR